MLSYSATGTATGTVLPNLNAGRVDWKRSKDHRRGHRRGSLPLKKRRVFTNLTADHGFVIADERQQDPSHLRMHRSSSLPPVFPSTSATQCLGDSPFSLLNGSKDFSFSKMNALSLIASAVVATEASIDSSSAVPPGLATLSFASTASEHSRELDCPTASDPLPPANSPNNDTQGDCVDEKLTASRVDDFKKEHYDRNEDCVAAPIPRKKQHSPTENLKTPPSCAQGKRLERSNSSSMGSSNHGPQSTAVLNAKKRNATPPIPNAAAEASAPTSASSKPSASNKKTAAPKLSSSAAAAVVSEAPCPDKRCSGHPDEIRCAATTTRGRACAYIAVLDTKYCFLHADYDTNPAPRRKSKDFGESMEGQDAMMEETIQEESLEPAAATSRRAGSKPKLKQRATTPVSKAVDEKPPSPSTLPSGTGSPQQPKKRFRRTSTKLAEKHADSPRPLLSMIATDQWFGKTVQIAVGPLEGRTGVVEKWGNGWISVNVKGAGLHNRRSFELYIDEEVSNASGEDGNHGCDNTDASSSEKNDRPAPSIARVISRDVVSPSPSTDSCKSRQNQGCAPSPKIARQNPVALDHGLMSPRHDGHKMTVVATVSPETPRPSASDPPPLSMDCSDTPIPTKSALEAASKLPLPKVTPFPERSIAKATSHTTVGLTDSSAASFDLQLPDTSCSKTLSGSKSMLFRPSMGERTRGRTTCSSSSEDDESSLASSSLAQRPKERSQLYLESSSSFSFS
jgi:hypothetical protein